MTETPATPRLGKFGIWRHAAGLPPELGSAIEQLGYGTIWVGGWPPADLEVVERLLDATTDITIATGIVNIWSAPATEVAASYHRIEARHPGRFLLGIGVGHPEATGTAYTKPYSALVRYLDALDRADVPTHRRVLAALGLGFDSAELSNGGSDRVIDALVAHGDADRVAERLTEHLSAGADHVAIEVLPPSGDPLPALGELAATLQR